MNDQFQAEYENQKLFLKSMIDLVPDLIFFKDKDSRYLGCNRAFSGDFIGLSENDIIGKTDSDFVKDKDLAKFFRQNDLAVMESRTARSNEETLTMADGRIVEVEVLKTPFFDTNGEIAGIIGISRNITERKNAEDKIKQLLNEKEILLQEVHHRIKNNMNVIDGLLRLQADNIDEPKVSTALNDAGDRVRSMLLLYDKLYRSSSYTEISVKDYLGALVDQIFAGFPHSPAICLEKSIDDIILEVKILSPLGIIINELVTNIMKYAFKDREQGLISISVSLSGESIMLVVQDDGVGIPESIDLENSGGFGLYLVRSLTCQMDGSLHIERDKGTRVTLTFGKN